MVQPERARARMTPTPARRQFLLAAAGAMLLVPVTGLLAGCGDDRPDPLEVLAKHARADATMIDGMRATNALKPDQVAMLSDIAAARQSHASALELALGEQNSTPASTSNHPTPAAGTAADALYRVREALDHAKESAGKVVLTVPREHAGLVGSIAACCAAYRSVLR